jgi:hypothetical protein
MKSVFLWGSLEKESETGTLGYCMEDIINKADLILMHPANQVYFLY